MQQIDIASTDFSLHRLLCRLVPVICLLLQADIGRLEDWIQPLSLLPVVVLEAFDRNPSEYQYRWNVGDYHKPLHHVCDIPYEACRCYSAQEDSIVMKNGWVHACFRRARTGAVLLPRTNGRSDPVDGGHACHPPRFCQHSDARRAPAAVRPLLLQVLQNVASRPHLRLV